MDELTPAQKKQVAAAFSKIQGKHGFTYIDESSKPETKADKVVDAFVIASGSQKIGAGKVVSMIKQYETLAKASDVTGAEIRVRVKTSPQGTVAREN